MSRIQHLRTRLPIHIGFVPVKKPGEETKDKNQQSTTQADTQVVNRKFFRQCPDAAIYISFDGRPMSFRRPFFLQFATLDSGRFVLAPQVSPQ